MGRFYTIETGFQTVSAAQDLLEIQLPSSVVAILHSIAIDQSSDVSSADAKKQQILLKRGIGATSGSGGGSATISKHQTGDASSGLTAERNNTSQAVAGGGSLATVGSFVWDVLAGLEHTPIPELRMAFSPSEYIVLATDAPADAVTANARIVLELLGG